MSHQFTVEPDKSYWAKIRLLGFMTIATNSQIADKFKELGFVDVEVKGKGEVRIASGKWTGVEATVDLPKEVVSAQSYDPAVDKVPEPTHQHTDTASDIISNSLG